MARARRQPPDDGTERTSRSTSTRQKRTPEEVVRYLVNANRGPDFVIEIPAGWRVTFGFVNPAKAGESYSRGDAHCMRVYEGEKLRAVYSDVRGFRDLSIPLARKVERETGSSSWTMDSGGNFEKTERVSRDHSLELEAGDDDVPF